MLGNGWTYSKLGDTKESVDQYTSPEDALAANGTKQRIGGALHQYRSGATNGAGQSSVTIYSD